LSETSLSSKLKIVPFQYHPFWWQLANRKANIATGSANNANPYHFRFQWGWQEWQKVARAAEQWFINEAGSQRSARFARDCWNLAWSRNVTSWKKVVETKSLWFLILMGVTEMKKKSSG
jgi:hypothetical protein